MKRAISAIMLTVVVASGCAQKRMTQFEYRDVRLEAGGRIRRAPALATADFKPGVYYSPDVAPMQVEIEVKLLEVARRDMEVLGVNWLAGSGPLIAASSLKNITPKETPMAMGGLVNLGIGSGRGRGGCPHGPGCTTCGSDSGGGLGGGISFPVIAGKGADKSPNVTAVRAIFQLDDTIEISDSYIALTIKLGFDADGKIIVQPMLLPVEIAPKEDPPKPAPVTKPSTTVRIRDDQTILIGGLVTDSEEEIKAKTPILGDIPLLGRMFKSKDRNTVKRDLIIFITPRIILNEE